MQPGETITPGSQPSVPPPSEDSGAIQIDHSQPQPATPSQTAPAPAAVVSPPAPIETTSPPPAPVDMTRQDAPWVMTNEDSAPDSYIQTEASDQVAWTASEYVAHSKNSGWFMLLAGSVIAVIVLVYVLTSSILSSIMVGIAGMAFGIFAARPPRVLQYSVQSQGLQIGPRLYPYQEIRSFTVRHEGPLPSIVLTPLKRFMPPITVFYDPESEDAIIDALSNYLPHEDKSPDVVDRLMSRIRF